MVTIGVTGHRRLADEARLEAAVAEVADRIEAAFPDQPLTVASSLAEGADRLVVRCLLPRPGARLLAILPRPRADYEDDFATEASRRDFAELLERADEVVELPGGEREAGYGGAGSLLVGRSDVLVALWDGREAERPHGTAAVVALARRRGLGLAWIHAGNRSPETGDPTSLGSEQGEVTYERFPQRRAEAVPAGRRARQWSEEAEWAAIAVLGLLALVLGYIGFDSYLDTLGEPAGWSDILYRDLQLFTLESGDPGGNLPWELDVARFMAPGVAVLATIKALTVVFRDRLALLRARLGPDHAIVCGLGRRGLRLTRSLLGRGERVVVIEADGGNELIRTVRRAGAAVLVGDATDPDILRRAGIGRAAHVVAVCGDDGINASVAVVARELAGRRPLTCLVHVLDPGLCEFLRTEQIATAGDYPFRLTIFNTFEDGARALVLNHPLTVPGRPERPHVVVVGVGRLGRALVAEIARSWRDSGHERQGALPVTLVDPEAEELRASLLLHHPWIAGVCDLRPSAVAAGAVRFDSGAFLTGAAPTEGVLAYVCLRDTARALDAALTLRQQLGDDARIVVRTETEEGLGSLIARRGAGGISSFALLDRVCDADAILGFAFNERLAREMHAYYAERREETSRWEELDESLRESNRDAARDVGHKLRTIGCEALPLRDGRAPEFEFSQAEIETLARMEHERWTAERLSGGWTLDDHRDAGAKTSPYLVPFDDVPESVQEQNRAAVRDLPRILARLGYGIARVG